MKKKKTKILLFLCLLIGIIAIIVIYTFKIKNEKYENIVYVNYDLNNEDIEGDYKTIHYYADLVYFLKNDVPEKYDADFFKNNAILIFKIIDENKRPEIQTYELSEESISIHLKTKRKNKNKYSGWWILLELPADNISNIENVNIFKNDNPLQVNLLSSDVVSFISMFDLRDDKTYYQHNEMHLLTNDFLAVYFRNTDIYPKITQELLGLENIISIKYLASSPSDYFLRVEPYRQILHIHFQQMNTTEFLKIIKIIEELEYVKYVKPSILYDGTKK